MKIALEAAKGLEYLHDKASPLVIYREFGILKHLAAKLPDFGLAKLGPVGNKTLVSSRVMGITGRRDIDTTRYANVYTKSHPSSHLHDIPELPHDNACFSNFTTAVASEIFVSICFTFCTCF
jgi:hypothetical protein